MSTDLPRDPLDDITDLEQDLGLPLGFFNRLGEEPDWSFVIKLHALFEAAITHLLEAKLKEPGLQKFVANLNMGGQFGKLSLVKSLEVLPPLLLRYIEALSAVRNDCIHDVRNVDFEFKRYIASLSEGKRQSLLGAIASNIRPIGENGARILERAIANHPKQFFFGLAMVTLAAIYQKKGPRIELPSGAFGDSSFGEAAFGE
jgi:hypothetical protein